MRPGFRAMTGTAAAMLAVATTAPAFAQMMIPKSAPLSGDRLFGQQCGACHSTVAGETRVGPSLAHVVGRKAGSLPGYQYSPALRKSKFVWNPATLDRWLADAGATIPGTNMPYAQTDAAKRKLLIDYLSTLK